MARTIVLLILQSLNY